MFAFRVLPVCLYLLVRPLHFYVYCRFVGGADKNSGHVCPSRSQLVSILLVQAVLLSGSCCSGLNAFFRRLFVFGRSCAAWFLLPTAPPDPLLRSQSARLEPSDWRNIFYWPDLSHSRPRRGSLSHRPVNGCSCLRLPHHFDLSMCYGICVR